MALAQARRRQWAAEMLAMAAAALPRHLGATQRWSCPTEGPPLPADQGANLKKSFLAAAIHPRCFYSVAVPDLDDPFVFEALKVVTKPWLTVNPIRAQ
eukprot:5111575-Pyramimonas_sp.AAC.1